MSADQIERDSVDERLLVDPRGCALMRFARAWCTVDARGFASL